MWVSHVFRTTEIEVLYVLGWWKIITVTTVRERRSTM